jgi:hypothetical protein
MKGRERESGNAVDAICVTLLAVRLLEDEGCESTQNNTYNSLRLVINLNVSGSR